jgi:hypothetical protein
MPDEKLSLPQTAVLLVLMAQARGIPNPELKQHYGLDLNGKDRLKLNDLKLVDSLKEGRAYTHVLTDKGWAYLTEEIRHGMARPTGSAGAALHALLAGLQGFMDRSDLRLGDIFTPLDDPAPVDASAPSVDRVASPMPSTKGVIEPDIELRIRAAYDQLAAEPGIWVSIPRLRSLLGQTPRADVDNALRRMILMPDVNIAPESNQKTLSVQDREAAVTIGDQDNHLLWIGAR